MPILSANTGINQTDAMDRPVPLGAVLAALRRQRRWLILAVLLIPALAYLAILQTTPRYTATATVVYEPSAFAAQELQSILREDPATDAAMASQAAIAGSLTVATRLAEKFDLFADPAFNASLRRPSLLVRVTRPLLSAANALLGCTPAPPPAPDAVRNAVLLAVQAALTSTPVRGSHAMEIAFEAPDAAQAAAIANEAADLYVHDALEQKYAAIERADTWLTERAKTLRAEVQADEDRIAAYRARIGLVQGVQAGLDTERASHLAADLLAARSDAAAAAARAAAARASGGASAQAELSPGAVAARAQAEQVAGQLSAAMTRLGPNHPDVSALRRQLADLRTAAGAETGRGLAALESDARAAAAKVASLERGMRDANDAVGRTASAEVPLNAMQRDADAARGLLQAVLERVQQTGQRYAIETPDARVISPALPPLRPTSPRTLPMMAVSLVAAVLLGLSAVYLSETGAQTFRGGEDVRAVLGLPCLALMPRLSRTELRRRPIVDYVAEQPLSPFAEQARATRAGLWFGSDNPRVVTITAARPDEGKTTATIALGRSATLAGERVVVVDCDLRQPALGRRLGVGAELGLVDCLQGHVTLDDVIHTDQRTGIDVIGAGSADGAPPDLFRGDAMAAVIDALRQRYALVLLDAPPAYAVTDARIIARLADATILCIRWRDTPRAVVRNAAALLEQARAHVAGVVLTRVDARVHSRSGFADAEVYHPRYGGYFRG